MRRIKYPRRIKPCDPRDPSISDIEMSGSSSPSKGESNSNESKNSSYQPFGLKSFPLDMSGSLSMFKEVMDKKNMDSSSTSSSCSSDGEEEDKYDKKKTHKPLKYKKKSKDKPDYYGKFEEQSNKQSSLVKHDENDDRCKIKKIKLVVYDTFAHFKIIDGHQQLCVYNVDSFMNSLRFVLFGNEYYVADDAHVTNSSGFLEVNSIPFNNTTPYGTHGPVDDGYLDHYKFVTYSECCFPALKTYELVYESCLSVRTTGTEDHPFERNRENVEDPFDDARLSTAGISLFDFETQLYADILFTNKSIYAAYGRLPICKNGARTSAAFLSLTRIGSRSVSNPSQDYQIVAIGYKRDTNLINYYINGNIVHSITQLGYRPANAKQSIILDHGGREEMVSPKQFWIGFGNYTYLDAHKPNNIEASDTYALVKLTSLSGYYFYPTRPDPDTGLLIQDDTFKEQCSIPLTRLWGQGVSMRLKYVKVYYKC